MNKISATGRLAADSELRFTPGGDAILNFRVASDVGFGDKKTTNWFACQVWGKRGEALQPHLTKGQQVTVFGTLVLREWTNKDGVKQLSPDIRVDEIELQGGKRQDSAPAKPQGKQEYSTPDNFVPDDIPF
jgi:single-strand DNA-binding protein